MRRLPPSALVLPIIVLLYSLSGCNSKQETASRSSDAGAAAAPNVANVLSVSPREGKVPNFSWKDSSGATIDFDAFKGEVTLINFWATWCGPCKKELPDLIALSSELAPRGVKILGISVDVGSDARGKVAEFVAKAGIPYQIVVDNDELQEAFGNVRSIPTSFLIDAEGNIAQTLVGIRTKEVLAQSITGLLK